MYTPPGTVDRIRTSLDRFVVQAGTPHGNEFLRQHIKELPFAMRMAKTALLAAHDTYPEFFANRIQNRYKKAGYTVLGLGLHSITLADGDSVLKVYRNTVGLDEAEQNEMKLYWERKQNVLLGSLSDHAVPQTFSIDSHPVDGARSVVLAHQPYVHAHHSIRLPLDSPAQLPESTFVAKCITMHDMVGAVPDIVGIDNIFMTDDGIRIVDTIPLEASDPTDTGAFQRARDILGIRDVA